MKDESLKANEGNETTEGEVAEDFILTFGEGGNKRTNIRYFLLGAFRVD